MPRLGRDCRAILNQLQLVPVVYVFKVLPVGVLPELSPEGVEAELSNGCQPLVLARVLRLNREVEPQQLVLLVDIVALRLRVFLSVLNLHFQEERHVVLHQPRVFPINQGGVYPIFECLF